MVKKFKFTTSIGFMFKLIRINEKRNFRYFRCEVCKTAYIRQNTLTGELGKTGHLRWCKSRREGFYLVHPKNDNSSYIREFHITF